MTDNRKSGDKRAAELLDSAPSKECTAGIKTKSSHRGPSMPNIYGMKCRALALTDIPPSSR
jgi:hypothetical protein